MCAGTGRLHWYRSFLPQPERAAQQAIATLLAVGRPLDNCPAHSAGEQWSEAVNQLKDVYD